MTYKFEGDITKLDLNADHYNDQNALFFADCARLAYEPESIIQQVMQNELGFKHFHFFANLNLGKKTSTEAFIASNEEMIIVAFRGTQEITDFLTDATFKLEDGPVGQVHRGFKRGLNEVWDNDDVSMKSYLERCQDNNQSIWFCGHSLGAALATLAAANYALKDNVSNASSIKGIYTIGQSRVGNSTFATAFDAILATKCFRIVNNSDAVPMLPPLGLLLKYKHVGQLCYIDSDGGLQLTRSWWNKILDIAKGIHEDLGVVGFDGLKNHKSAEYIAALKKIKEASFSPK